MSTGTSTSSNSIDCKDTSSAIDDMKNSCCSHGADHPHTEEKVQTSPLHKKTKVERAQSYLTVISTSIGIIGAVGTGFVWIAANVYVGDVEIRPDKPVEAVTVKVIDRKGQQATYFTKHIQLMPGSYHLVFGIPYKQPMRHADVNVQLWKGTVVPYAVPAVLTAAPSTDDYNPEADQPPPPPDTQPGSRKHWWQFWRKNHDTASSEANKSATVGVSK